jgi:hypothetical protein
MSSISLPRILLQRWYVVLIGIVATVGLVVGASTTVKPTYQASANVLLVPPPSHVGGNPYLELGGLEPVADVLARSLVDDTTAQLLTSQGLTGTYKAARDLSVSGPVLVLIGQGTSAAEALEMMRGIAQQVAPQLLKLQLAAGVSSAARLTTEALNTPTKATAITKSQMRAEVAAAILGLVLTLLAVFGLHRMSTVSARRRSAADVRRRVAAADQRRVTATRAAEVAEVAQAGQLPQVRRRRVRARATADLTGPNEFHPHPHPGGGHPGESRPDENPWAGTETAAEASGSPETPESDEPDSSNISEISDRPDVSDGPQRDATAANGRTHVTTRR